MTRRDEKLDERTPGEAFDEAHREYKASLDPTAQNNRFLRKRYGLGGTGDSHIDTYRLWWVRETIRHMVRDDSLPRQMLERLTDFLYGGDHGADLSFHMEPDSGDPVLDQELAARFKRWGNDKFACDHYGERTLAGMVWQAGYQGFQDGEMFGLLTDEGKVQLLEADRCQMPTNPEPGWANGLKFADDGRVEGYWFTRKVPEGPWAISREEVKYYARMRGPGVQQVVHCYSSTRLSQHRGYGVLVPIIVESGMLDDLEFATIVKAQAAANIVGVTTTDARGGGSKPELGATESKRDLDGNLETHFKSKSGTWVNLPSAKKFEGFSPPIPSERHIEHCKHVLKKISAAQHLPYILAMLDANETNLSAWRGAVDAARYSWRRLRGQHSIQLLWPIYAWKAMQWLPSMGPTARRLWRAGTYTGVRTVWRGWGYIEPKKDVEADAKTLENLLNSRRGLLEKLGLDEDRVRLQTIRDNKRWILEAIEAAAEIQKENADWDVTWRDLICLTAAMDQNAPAQELTATLET